MVGDTEEPVKNHRTAAKHTVASCKTNQGLNQGYNFSGDRQCLYRKM